MKRVSIVTISFNQVKYLEEAILSVLGQDYPNLEYIVVDPGSTDGSLDVIERYRSRISKIILRPDRGPADGLNIGFAEATGEIFGFVNADDLLYPGALKRVAEFFDSHPTCDLVMGNGDIIDADGRVQRHVKARGFSTRRYFYGGTRMLQQSTFFGGDMFRRSPGFNIANRTCWDGELFLEFAKLGAGVGYIDANLSGFRIYGESISGSRRLADAYLADSKRLFRQNFGRDWQSSDEIPRFFYRCEGLLIRAWGLVKTVFGKRETA